MKAIILARVSTEEQMNEGQSIPAQLERARNYCRKNNLEITNEYQIDESSTKDHRKKFEKVVEQLKEATEKVALIVETIDRLQRSFRESVLLDDFRREGRLEIHFLRENLVLHKDSNSSDLLRWDMGVMFARSYVLQLSDNVKRVFEQKLRSGEWIGQPRVGYQYVNTDGKKDLVWDPERAYLVRKMFELYASGQHSVKTLKYEMDKLGLRSRNEKKMSPGMIHKVLKDKFYIGIMTSKGREYPHRYQPLISLETFDKVQRLLASFQKKSIKYAVKPFAFRGIIHCSKCGCLLSPEIKKEKYTYYSCTNYKGICKKTWIREEELLEPIHKLLEGLKMSQERVDTIVEDLRVINENKNEYHRREIDNLQKDYNGMQDKIDRLVDLLVSRSITQDIYDKKLKEYKEKQYELNIKMEEYTRADENYHITASTVFSLANRALEIFQSSEANEKRQILNFLLQNCRLSGKKLSFELRSPFDTILEVAHHPTGLRGRDSNPQPID